MANIPNAKLKAWRPFAFATKAGLITPRKSQLVALTLMNVTRVWVHLENVDAMPFAPIHKAAIAVLANLVTLVIPTSIVMTLTNVKIVAFVAERHSAKTFLALLNAHVSTEHHSTQ